MVIRKLILPLALLMLTNSSFAGELKLGVVGGFTYTNLTWNGKSGNSGSFDSNGIGGALGFTASLFQDHLVGLRVIALEHFMGSHGLGPNAQKTEVSGSAPFFAATANVNLDHGDIRDSYGMGMGFMSMAALKRSANVPWVKSAVGPLLEAKVSPKKSRWFGYGYSFLPVMGDFKMSYMFFVGGGFELFGASAK